MIKLKSSSQNHKLQEIILLDNPAHQNIILVKRFNGLRQYTRSIYQSARDIFIKYFVDITIYCIFAQGFDGRGRREWKKMFY